MLKGLFRQVLSLPQGRASEEPWQLEDGYSRQDAQFVVVVVGEACYRLRTVAVSRRVLPISAREQPVGQALLLQTAKALRVGA